MLSLLGSRSSSPWVSMHGDRISAVCVGNDEQMASRVTQAWQLWEHTETPFPISILMKTCRMVTYQWHINARQKGRLSSDPQGPPTPQKSTSYSRTPPSKDPPEQERHLGTMGLNTGVHTGHFTSNHHGPRLRTHQPMIISSTQVCSRRIQKSDSSPMYRMSGSQWHPGADQHFQGGEIELVKTRNCHHIIRVSDWEF